MQSFEKRQYIIDVVNNLINVSNIEISPDTVVDDIIKTSEFIFATAESENELFNSIRKLANASLSKFGLLAKGKNQQMEDSKEPLYHIADPKTLSFDLTGDSDYYNNLLSRLYELDKLRQNKNYAFIFYERYIQKLPWDMICRLNEIDSSELNTRILDIVKFVNKDN